MILKRTLDIAKKFISKGLFFTIGSVAIFSLVWYIHFSLGKVATDDKYYKASDKYKNIMSQGITSDPKYFPAMLKDNLAFMVITTKASLNLMSASRTKTAVILSHGLSATRASIIVGRKVAMA